MRRTFGFSFSTPLGLILFLVLLVAFVPAYRRIIQKSIRNHPATTRRAVEEHCRYMLGKQVGTMPPAELAAEFQRCSEFRIKSVEAAGGVFNPVMVRITLETQPRPPLGKEVFIFKSADINTGKFSLLSGLTSLITGRWAFNSYNTYSNTTFSGSF